MLSRSAGATPSNRGRNGWILRSCLVYYLDRLVCPDISPALLAVGGVTVCRVSLIIYATRMRQAAMDRV